jgi:DNA topoisomerase III
MVSMKVIITEKPSVAKDIAQVLKVTQKKNGYFEGNGYFITWALGHLIQLQNPDDYDEIYKKWSVESLPIIPSEFLTTVIKQGSTFQQYSIIESLLKHKDSEEVICATDAGREGELIFRLIYEKAKSELPIKRLWISSQTDQAILEGFANLKDGTLYDGLFDSARSRSEADWLIGMNATRAYTSTFSRGHGVMSVGRVQTPVLKIIVDRYYDHVHFKPKEFYEVFAECNHKNGPYKTKLIIEKNDRFEEKSNADNVVIALKRENTGHIYDVKKKKKKENAPLLYDLTELQKEANRKFKFSADQTLSLMQALYEKHKILTYPRTSSRYLSKDMIPKLNGLFRNLEHIESYGAIASRLVAASVSPGKRVVDDKKVTDHHAIIPTDKKPELSLLSPDEKKLYDLVIRRFLCVFLEPCLKDHTELITAIGKHQFKCTGTTIQSLGWRELYQSEKTYDNQETLLPQVRKGDVVNIKEILLNEGKTKAPSLHTEASILAAMETAGKYIEDDEARQAMKDSGLGTPATRAQILERLLTVEYIVREKHKLIPTQKGQFLVNCIQDQALVSPELTGEWEKRLNDMAKNNYNRQRYMKEVKAFTTSIVGIFKQSEETLASDVLSLGSCPKCKDGHIVERLKGYSCSAWKSTQCDFVIWKLVAGLPLLKNHIEALLKNGVTDRLSGFKSKAGKAFDAAVKLENNELKFEFNQITGTCPLCQENIVEREKVFSCMGWSKTKCPFTVWKKIAGKEITSSHVGNLIKNGKTDLIKGFLSKAGKPFDAILVLSEGKTKFQFQ